MTPYLVGYVSGAGAGLDDGADDARECLDTQVLVVTLWDQERPLQGRLDLGDQHGLRIGGVVGGGDGGHQHAGQRRAVLVVALLSGRQQLVQDKRQHRCVLKTHNHTRSNNS